MAVTPWTIPSEVADLVLSVAQQQATRIALDELSPDERSAMLALVMETMQP